MKRAYLKVFRTEILTEERVIAIEKKEEIKNSLTGSQVSLTSTFSLLTLLPANFIFESIAACPYFSLPSLLHWQLGLISQFITLAVSKLFVVCPLEAPNHFMYHE